MKIRIPHQRLSFPFSRMVILPVLVAVLAVSGLGRALAENELVPVTFNGESIPKVSQLFLASQRYAILSREGEPITFTVKNRSRAKLGDITLHDSSGALVADQTVEPGSHDIRFEVPKPGVYFMEYSGENPLWSITIPEGTSAVLCLEAEKPMNHSGAMAKRYFYVPKGTKEIQYTAESGHLTYQLEILDPDGVVVQVVDQNHPTAPIPVESGADGQVWTFNAKAFAPIFLSFENIPNYLAVSPDALLLPKDLVEKDGL